MEAARYNGKMAATAPDDLVSLAEISALTADKTEGDKTMKRWLYGWYMFGRAVYLSRAKRHGAGPMKWKYAIRMGRAYRFIVDGQFHQ